ncbi:MAG: patatin-like phospholipase family protein [Leptospiraceae bacterium]|nr:patatin-like phospholipase family protein [Leptospiraceae bacterium]
MQLKNVTMKKGLVLSGGGGRGAYQAGVYRYLSEKSYTPDIVCGASVGAINAVAIASGMDSQRIEELWESIKRKNVMRYSYWNIIKNFFLRRFSPIADSRPLENYLKSKIDFSKIKDSPIDLFVPAVNIVSGQLEFFDKNEITVRHIMASSSMPIIFPWQEIDGRYYWDGGLMANTPVLPLIERDVRDIIIVILSPVGSNLLELPRNTIEAAERAFELSLLASFENFKSRIEQSKSKFTMKSLMIGILDRLYKVGDYRFRIVSPNESLGVSSILNFTGEQARKLIELGYNDAKEQIGEP